MKRFLLCVISICIGAIAMAQNIVPNPGFENYNACPPTLSGFAYTPTYTLFPYCTNWINPSNFSSSDYFNACASSGSGVSVPVNFVGYQPAHGGNAYAGFYAWYSNYTPTKPYMEYVETKLTAPMITGHKYLVSFWANLANNSFGSALVGINTVAAHLSDTELYDPTSTPCMFASEDVWDTTVYVDDTSKWVQIKGVYKAKSSEQWITIGHFWDTTFSQSYHVISGASGGNKISYVYVDDVSITPFSDTETRDTSFCTSVFPFKIPGLKDTGIFSWSTGDTTRYITVDTTGWGGNNNKIKSHWYVRTTLLLPDSSLRIDSVLISFDPKLHLVAHDTIVCPGIPVTRWANYATFDSYSWDSGEKTDTLTIKSPQKYILTVTNSCGIQRDTFNLFNYSIPPPPKVNDTSVCLNVVVPPLAVYGQNIKWYLHSLDTFSFDNQPLLPTNHRIHDTVYVTQTVNGCESPKSQIVVRIIEKPKFDLGNDTILCHGKSFVLGKENDSIDFKWNTGQLGCCINVELPGTYILDGANVCGHYFDTVTIQSYPCDTCLWAPSAFTPNGDGRNDVFNVKVRCPIKEFKFVIHNRYGQTVFQGNAQHMGWDGTLFGVPQDPGVYFYFVELNTGIPDDDTKILKGDLTLIR